MNKPVTVAVLQAGLVPASMLVEMGHWGLPVKFVEEQPTLDSVDEIIDCLREAVEGDDAVKLRDTDLDALAHYLKGNKKAKLTVFDPVQERSITTTVTYVVLPNGNYLIPWTDDTPLVEMLQDPRSYLKVDGQRVTFQEVDELFFGGKKAFVSAKSVPNDGEP